MTDTPQPLGLTDFFALEAGEYLERLDALLGRPDAATLGEEFVRLSRALRGSALMANHHAIARAAQGLEGLARAVRGGQRPWDEAARQSAVRAVDDLKILMRRTAEWNDADTARAEALAVELERVAGRPSPGPVTEPRALDAGARAFVAREGAAIASTLDRAAQGLRQNPEARDPLQHVLRALQPLRGLAALTDLPPLPDLLEGIERAIADLARTPGAAPPLGGDVFQAAATAIAHAARDVAERGKPDPESAEFQRFAELLLQFLDSGPSVVPVSALYYDDAGPHIVERGAAAAPPAALGRVELVSHGEHLRQAADSLERAPSATQRELRAHALLTTFRALAESSGGPLADALASFAIAARDAVTAGCGVRHAAAFAAQLRQAGDLLARAEGRDDAALAARLGTIAQNIQALDAAALAPEAPAPVVVAQPPAPQVAPPRPTIPAPTPPRVAAPPAPARASGAPPAEQAADLSGSWSAYEGFLAEGIGPASLEALLAGGTSVAPPSSDTARPAPAAAARAPSAAVPAPRAPTTPPPLAELPVVDIRQLQYRGTRALERARELREEAQHASGEDLRALVEEVCDLVGLALEADA